MLDGLHEIEPELRDRCLLPSLLDLCRRHPNCRYLVSSLPVGYPPGSLQALGFAECDLLDFGAPEIIEYARHWCIAVRLALNAPEEEARRDGPDVMLMEVVFDADLHPSPGPSPHVTQAWTAVIGLSQWIFEKATSTHGVDTALLQFLRTLVSFDKIGSEKQTLRSLSTILEKRMQAPPAQDFGIYDATLFILMEGISWAVEKGVDIISMSLGFSYYEPMFREVFEIFINQYGVLPVVAVGNENHGNSSSPGNASTATPHVAGVAALLMAAKPESTVTDIMSILKKTARHPLGTGRRPDNRWGYGFVIPVEALKALQ